MAHDGPTSTGLESKRDLQAVEKLLASLDGLRTRLISRAGA
jgi:hypothetical protein